MNEQSNDGKEEKSSRMTPFLHQDTLCSKASDREMNQKAVRKKIQKVALEQKEVGQREENNKSNPLPEFTHAFTPP